MRLLKLLALAAALVTSAKAQSVTFQWDPSPSPVIVSYRVYASSFSIFNTNATLTVVTVPAPQLSVTLTNLLPGVNYSVYATAIDGTGAESDHSNTVLYSAPVKPSPPVNLRRIAGAP